MNIDKPKKNILQKFKHVREKIRDFNLFLPKKDMLKYDFDKYIYDLENGKFRDQFHLGIYEENGDIKANLQRFEKSPNAIFVGAMGTGKSASASFTVTTWFAANSDQTILFLVDTLKGGNEYRALFPYKNVYRVNSESGVSRVIDLLYDEAMARKVAFNRISVDNIIDYEKTTGKKMPRLLTVMEEFHAIPYIIWDFNRNYQNEGTSAFKFFQLMKIGRSYGIWFIACSQKGTQSDVPSQIVPNFLSKQIFKVSKAEATYFLGDVKASEIKNQHKGRCETELGTVQFPFMHPDKTQAKLLKKYAKPLDCECIELRDEIISSYISGNSTEELYQFKKLSDLCRGIEGYEPHLVISILHQKLGHDVKILDARIDPYGISLIVDWPNKFKVAVAIRVKSKLTGKHIKKLEQGMKEYNCPRGIIYTSQEDLPKALYQEAVALKIEIVDHEDLIKMARQIEAKHAVDLSPEHLADDAKESGEYQTSHHISNVVEPDEDESIQQMDSQTPAITVDESQTTPIQNPNIINIKISEQSTYIKPANEKDEPLIVSAPSQETLHMAEKMMLSGKSANVKFIKRVEARGAFAYGTNAANTGFPVVLMNFDRNSSNEVYRIEVMIVNGNNKQIIHRYFVDRKVNVDASFSNDELIKLGISGTNDWNTQIDKVNAGRTAKDDDSIAVDLNQLFDSFRDYSESKAMVYCWKQDKDLVQSLLVHNKKYLKQRPFIIEDLYEESFGEGLSKDQLQNRFLKNQSDESFYFNLEALYEVFKNIH